MNVLFFSRGRGRGHAIPDVAIAKELLCREPSLSLQFASYGTGADTLRSHGYEVIDLKLPDDNPFFETLIRSIRVINDICPSLVISHEEFCIAPAAKVFDLSCLFLIDWFPPNGTVWMDALMEAGSVVFMDEPGYFDEPEALRGRIEYVGPVIRDLTLTREDKSSARIDLGLPHDRPIILILPGGAAASSEQQSPLFDLVTGAIDMLCAGAVAVWVLPTHEQAAIQARIASRSDIVFMKPHLNIEKTMVASDVVITKGTRKTSLELNALGIQSISISHGLNPVDDYRVSQIKTNIALRAKGLTPGTLNARLLEVMREKPSNTTVSRNHAKGKHAAVSAIQRHLRSHDA